MKFLRPVGLFSIVSFAICPCTRAIEIPTTPVGNPGNAPDALTGLGNVDYPYSISKYEITNTQFCEFVNACMGDPNYPSLKNAFSIVSGMNAECGIERAPTEGDSKKMQVRPKPGCENFPVRLHFTQDGTDAAFARDFVTWINGGTSPIEEIDAGTVEVKSRRPKKDGNKGFVKDAAGKVVYEEVVENRKVTQFRRKQPAPGGTWFLADANELYKAAFHDAKAGVAGIYFNFSTASNRLPIVASSGAEAHLAALSDNVADAQNPKAPIYPVGASSPSPYGAFDLTGNAPEIYFREDPTKPPRGYVLLENAAPSFGGGCERVAELQSRATCIVSNSQLQSTKQRFINATSMEGFRLVRIMPVAASVPPGTTRAVTPPRIATSSDGDGWLYGIPSMTTAGATPSELDWEWARSTIASTQGKKIQVRSSAEAQTYMLKLQGNGSGTPSLFFPAAKIEAETSGAKCKPIFEFSSRKSLSEIFGKYNRMVAKGAQVEADTKKLTLDMAQPLRSCGAGMDAEIFKKSRARETSDISKFEQKVIESVKLNSPLMWAADEGVLIGDLKNNGSICAVIIGINPKTHEIIFAANPKQTQPARIIRRAATADAYAATIGLYSIDFK